MLGVLTGKTLVIKDDDTLFSSEAASLTLAETRALYDPTGKSRSRFPPYTGVTGYHRKTFDRLSDAVAYGKRFTRHNFPYTVLDFYRRPVRDYDPERDE